MEKLNQPPKREKFLNVVYFIDGSRTYTLKLSVKTLAVIGSICGVILIWSVTSIFFLTRSHSENNGLRAEYKKSLAKILDYQISNDKVYEQAYPQKETPKTVTEVKSQVKEISKETPKDAPKDLAKTEPAKAEPVQNKVEEKKPEAQPASDSLRIIASNPRFKREGGAISFAFDLKNENSKGQSEGFVWVVAEVSLTSGSTVKIAAPASVTFDQNGEIKNHKQAYRFSIKRFREREFRFKEPKDGLELKKATVFVTDIKRTKIDKFEFATGLNLKESVKSGALRVRNHKRQLAARK